MPKQKNGRYAAVSSDGHYAKRCKAFHVRKKRKNYAMFFYDIFHTILELPFLGLYPMVFCAYAPRNTELCLVRLMLQHASPHTR